MLALDPECTGDERPHRPLNIRPDVDDDDIGYQIIGPNFLWEFEQAKKVRENEQIVQNGSAVEHVENEKGADRVDQKNNITIIQNASNIVQMAEKDVGHGVKGASEKEPSIETVNEEGLTQD